MSTWALDTSRSARFDAGGIARLFIGPQVFGESWRVRRMTVSTDSTSDTDARVYIGLENDSRMVAGTYSGNRDFNETDITLLSLDTFIVVWDGGNPGANAIFYVQGTASRAGY